MAEYDFRQLSPDDFENMSRDLLQASENLILESFKNGKDGGIDFRYTKSGMHTIVQCKHYVRTGLTGLLRDLGTEAAKVRKLKPKRYILVTSVPLSPGNKKDIIKIIGAGVLKTSDILGQDDLNNLLGLFPAIQERHYKLWLASTVVLNRVLHNAAVTQSEFHVKKVYKNIPKYVQSDAFPRAVDMLNRERIVVVAGPPGVGKTTLANLLLYQHLEKGYQAIVIQGDIREGKDLFQEGASQIFYYDDFMGTTFLGDRGSGFKKNEDRALVEFISMVQASPKGRMVLTTREHILSQAIEKSERIRHSDLSDRKVILRISDYSFKQRAKILYNHLHFSDLPVAHQDELLRGEFYFQIIKHQKFNPRLIEWLSTFRRLKNVEAKAYQDFVKHLLDDPSEIWRHAYENEISNSGRTLLLTLFTLNGKDSLTTLESAFKELHTIRSERYGFARQPEDFKVALRELAGSFIKVEGNDAEVIDPSVLDLLNAVIRDSTDNAIDLINGAISFTQIAHLWSFSTSEQSQSVLSALTKSAESTAEKIKPLLLKDRKIEFENGCIGYRGETFERRLAILIEMADNIQHPSFLSLVTSLFSRLEKEWETEDADIGDGIGILQAFNKIKWSQLDSSTMPKISIRCRDALLVSVEQGCPSDQLRDFISALPSDEMEEPAVLAALRKSIEKYQEDHFREDLNECRSTEQFDGLIGDLAEFQKTLNIDLSHEIEIADDAKAEFEQKEQEYADHMQDEWKERYYESRDNESTVREMFGSLTSDRS